jgi:acyl carrier protein
MNIMEDLEKYLLSEMAVDRDKKSLASDEDLLEQGIIDSLGIMKLILHMESAFGIKISDDDVVPENFQRLNSMVKFVENKMQNK